MARPLSDKKKNAIRFFSTIVPPLLFLTLTPDWAMSAIAQAYVFSYAGSWAVPLAEGTLSLFLGIGGFGASDLTIGACCDRENQVQPEPLHIEIPPIAVDDIAITAQETGNTIEIHGYYHYPRLFERRILPPRSVTPVDEPSADYHQL